MNIEDIFASIVNNKPLINKMHQVTDDAIFFELQSLGVKDISLLDVIEEVVMNAREHGSQKIEMYLSKIFNEVFVVIRDYGKGIHQTIPENRNLSDTKNKSASALLRLACEEGITGTGIRGRGVGLFLLSQLCTFRNGEILLASDSGLLLQRNDIFFQKNLAFSITGTVVCMRFRSLS